MTRPLPVPSDVPPRLPIAPILIFGGILLLLALRLTMTESLYHAFAQQTALFKARANPIGGVAVPEIGPAVTTGLAAVALLLTAAAAACAARARGLSRTDLGQFFLIAAILVFGVFSSIHADNRFVAIVGLSDVAMALFAGWSVRLLCHRALLGSAGRRMLVAMLLAVLAIWTVRGLYQRFVDIPDTIDYYNHHRDEALASQGMTPDDPAVQLYESRMLSREVTGYVTLSNVMGAGMIGLLAVLAGTLAARTLARREQEAPPPTKKATEKSADEIPLDTVWMILAVALLLVGTVVLFLTESRGASVLGVACILALFAGTFFWQRVVRHRRAIIATTFLLIALGAAAIIAYGIARDTLPVKSLMFRWHYWTASVPLIEHSPLLGVGLNNFGDCYPSVKRASSPEDVKDPHSFFVRFAAETGLPAALLVAILILWMSLRATRPTSSIIPPSAFRLSSSLIGLAFCLLWWILHQLLAESQQSYFVILSALSAAITWGTWCLADWLLAPLDSRGMRYILIAALLGALGMLLYDQINMALVTGPVAMLFWVLLGAASSADNDDALSPAFRIPALTAGIVTAAASFAVILCLWWPTLRGTMPWDPAPWVTRYLETIQAGTPNYPGAKAALTEAIARDPRSIPLRRQLMLIKEHLGESVIDDIHQILTLDRTSFRLRISLATEPSDLPRAERLQLLQKAEHLNDQLSADEVMRLTPSEHEKIEAARRELKGGGG